MVMICRVKLADFQEWNRLLITSKRHQAAGLTLLNMWRPQEDLESVFFIFSVRDVAEAEAFLGSDEIAGEKSQSFLSPTEYYFAENADGY